MQRSSLDTLRLAELIAALSRVSDLGMGQPPESAIRSCLMAITLARRMGIAERDLGDIYYATLLQHVGCTAYAHETADVFGGDDIAIRAGGLKVDFAVPREAIGFLLREVGHGKPTLTRARAVLTATRKGRAFDQKLSRSNCEVAVRIALRLGLGIGAQRGLNEIYERWDGNGSPNAIAGHEIALPARFAQVASQAVLFHGLGGSDLAVEVVRRRAGSMLDPGIAHAFVDHGVGLLVSVDAMDPSIAVIEAEPRPQQHVEEEHVDRVAMACADLVEEIPDGQRVAAAPMRRGR